jgi:hypothetical protein
MGALPPVGLNQAVVMMNIGLVVLAALVLQAQPPAAPRAAIDFKGKLYRAVFVPGPDTLSSGDIAQVAEPLRTRLSRFLTRRSAFSSTYQGAPNDIVGVARDAKRRAVERAIVSLIEVDGIEQRAVEFVTAAPIAYEWEGQPDGPLEESSFAEQVLQKDPSTPLAPFLYLFIAQRQRAAAEAAQLNSKPDLVKAATAKSHEFLQKARGAADPIFGLVADDLERVPFVYVKPGQTPQKAGAAGH